MSANRRRALIEEMGEEFKRRLDAELPEDPLTLDEIEAVVEKWRASRTRSWWSA